MLNRGQTYQLVLYHHLVPFRLLSPQFLLLIDCSMMRPAHLCQPVGNAGSILKEERILLIIIQGKQRGIVLEEQRLRLLVHPPSLLRLLHVLPLPLPHPALPHLLLKALMQISLCPWVGRNDELQRADHTSLTITHEQQHGRTHDKQLNLLPLPLFALL